MGRPSLYDTLGDALAFSALHEQFRRIDVVVRSHRGAVVKTIGEGVLAVFSDPESAVRAAIAIPLSLDAGKLTGPLRLRAAVHRGPVMSATLNDQLDYFGVTVYQLMETLALAPEGALVLTRAVASDPGVADRLADGRLGGTVLPGGRDFGPLLRVNLRPDRVTEGADRRAVAGTVE